MGIQHIDNTRDVAGTATVIYNDVSGSCTNDCHVVVDNSGDWKDAADLGCTNCHSSGNIGTLPATGLHTSSYAATVEAHDDSFTGGGTCVICHTDPPTGVDHIDGTLDDPSTATFGFATAGSLIAINNVSDAVATNDSCTALCHADGGDWARLWSTDADSLGTTPGDAFTGDRIFTTGCYCTRFPRTRAC